MHVRVTASIMTLSMLGMSFMPSLAAAEAGDQAIEAAASAAAASAAASVEASFEAAESVQTVGYEVVETPTTNHSLTVTSSEVAETLGSLDGLLEESSTVQATTDADSAAVVETDTGSVDIPRDASDPVVFAAEGAPAIEITLPNSDAASNGAAIDDGVVAYAAADGSANAVQADSEGGVKMLTVIDNVSAPTEYTYGVTVPEGGVVELTSEGGAVVLGADNQPIAIVDVPWATDAAGNSVQTWFTTDGVSLTQHVLHTADGVVYPVTADPWVYRWFGAFYELNRSQTRSLKYSTQGLGILIGARATIIGGVALELISLYAEIMYDRGGCMGIGVSWLGHPTVYGYYGGNCR